jgi:hypothetical protein
VFVGPLVRAGDVEGGDDVEDLPALDLGVPVLDVRLTLRAGCHVGLPGIRGELDVK